MAENRKTGGGQGRGGQHDPQRDSQQPMTATERELLEKFKAAEAKQKEAERRAEEAEQALAAYNTSGLKVKYDEKPMGAEDGYLFEIGPRVADPRGTNPDAKRYPHLPVIRQRAVDESELIRWYCLTHEHPPGTGRRLDTVAVPLFCHCVDKAKSQAVNLALSIANIRRKLDSGSPLSEREQELYERHEARIIGFEEVEG